MLRRLLKLVAINMSLGWLVPLFLAVRFTLNWCQLEGSTAVSGRERIANSFPYLHEAERMWSLAAVWAALSAVCWLIIGGRYIVNGRMPQPDTTNVSS